MWLQLKIYQNNSYCSGNTEQSNEMLKFAKVNSVKSGRTTDDKNIVLTINFVSIVAYTPTNSIYNNLKHISTFREVSNIDYLKRVM